EQTHLQLSREPRALPKLVIKRKPDSLFDYRFDDFEIEGYDPQPEVRRRWRQKSGLRGQPAADCNAILCS
ncbi:thymidylate synthase, partial [Salmonella enterica subsp. enterica serovar Cerro]|nr:thymidylate synthase [Salmonella enterica subsp. enterica serovar Cerro]